MSKPIVLCVLDGWGYRDAVEDNAIKLARTPVYDRLWQTAPRAMLATSGRAVGLPDGQMGNSEVGHMNIGAGRVVMQDLPRIDTAIEDGSLSENNELAGFITALKASGGTAHVAGLVSPGGVHSHQRHMLALVRRLSEAGISVALHAISDGRDVAPKSWAESFATISDTLAGLDRVSVATLSGRYFAMDRDKRWERIGLAYAAMVEGEGIAADDADSAIADAYQAGEGDEFVRPRVVGGYGGMADGDGLLFTNFRADRARQILTALVDPDFDGFARRRVDFAARLGMVDYSTDLSRFMPALFPAIDVRDGLGETLAAAGRRQLRIAETEKYPHVTYFFNGGDETVFEGEERILVPSPKVATYDLQPEMSAAEVTDRVVAAIDGGTLDAVIINYANPDMVGHTGILPAAIKAVETVDACLGRLLEAVERAGGAALITADHGNVELMRDPETGGPHTSHTTFDVPLLLANGAALTADPGAGRIWGLDDGKLADLAPTMLAMLGLAQPQAMTGGNLLRPVAARQLASHQAQAASLR